MNASDEHTDPAAPVRREQLLRVGKVASAALLFVTLFFVTPQTSNTPKTYGLDNSWAGAYHHFSKTDALAGVDYQFTYGPYYFLQAKLHDADRYYGYFYARAALAVVSSACLTWIAFSASSIVLRVLIAVALILILPLSGTDLATAMAIIAPTLAALSAANPWTSLLIGFAVVAGFMALSKFTFFVLAGIAIALVCAKLITLERNRAAGSVAAMFAVTLLSAWFAAGQTAANFPAFIAGSLALSESYMNVMGLERQGFVLITLFVGTAFAGIALLLHLFHRRAYTDFAIVLFSLACLALAWKMGINRGASGHDRFLLGWVVFILLFLARYVTVREMPLRAGVIAVGVIVAMAGWMQTGVRGFDNPIQGKFEKPVLRVADNLNAHFKPRATKAKHDRHAAGLARLSQLPETREVVGNASIDMFPPAQSFIFANRMNYHPRPVFQGYQAGTPETLAVNKAHYTGANGPEYILFELGAIDGRLPAIEDSGALLAVFTHYEPVMSERFFVLHQRRDTPLDIVERSREKRAIGWDRWIECPQTDGWQLATIGAHLNPLGRLRARAIRTPAYTIEMQLSDGTLVTHRLNTVCAAEPFVFHPYLEPGLGLLGHEDGPDARTVSRFRLVNLPGTERYFESEIAFETVAIDPLR